MQYFVKVLPGWYLNKSNARDSLPHEVKLRPNFGANKHYLGCVTKERMSRELGTGKSQNSMILTAVARCIVGGYWAVVVVANETAGKENLTIESLGGYQKLGA